MLSGRLLSYLKKRKIIRNGHLLSFVVTRYHSLYHSLSLIVPIVVIRCHSLYHSLSLVCLFINDPFSVVRNLMPVRFGLKISKAIKVCIFYLVCRAKTGYPSSSTQQSYLSLDNLLYMHIR